MNAYSTEGWSDFLVASAGASAALAGLVFIGISINLKPILEMAGLPARAGQTIVVLATALGVSLALLGPGESRVVAGLEVLIVGGGGWLAVTIIQWHSGIQARSDEPHDVRGHRRSSIFYVQVATVPFVIGGVSVLVSFGGGLYWMQAGVVLSLLVGLVNGWVLLIEILR
jgi:hypothetical protein